MNEGVAKLLEQKKAEKKAGKPVSAEQREQGRSFLQRVTRKSGPAGKPVIPAPLPSERPEHFGDVVEKAEVPGEKHASRSITLDVQPEMAADVAARIKKAAEDDWGDDPLALVLGEGDDGLLTAPEKTAADDSIYSSREPHPVALFKTLGRDFNRLEWTLWEPEHIVRAISEMTSNSPSEEVRNMIGALGGLVESEAFWNEHHVFLWTAQALNGQVPIMTTLPELSPEEVVFAVGVANLIRDGETLDLPNGETLPGVTIGVQVAATIAAVFHMAGLVYAPEPVDIANEHLSKLHEPEIKLLAKRVAAAWEQISEEVEPDLEADTLGLQLARLVDIRDYVRNPYA